MGTPRKPMTVEEAVAVAIGRASGYSSITVMKKNFLPHARAAIRAMREAELNR